MSSGKCFRSRGRGRKRSLTKSLANADLPAQPNHHGMVQFDGAPVCVVRADRSGYDGFDLIVQTAQLSAFAQRLTDLGAAWVGAQAQNILRVEAGIPRYGVDFSEDNLLLEVALDDAVSFTKGCYLGQEVVERIRSRGHVNKKLCGLLLDGNTPASPGDKLSAGGKEVGQITSSVASLRTPKADRLGLCQQRFLDAGHEVDRAPRRQRIRRDGDHEADCRHRHPGPLNPRFNSVY